MDYRMWWHYNLSMRDFMFDLACSFTIPDIRYYWATNQEDETERLCVYEQLWAIREGLADRPEGL